MNSIDSKSLDKCKLYQNILNIIIFSLRTFNLVFKGLVKVLYMKFRYYKMSNTGRIISKLFIQY